MTPSGSCPDTASATTFHRPETGRRGPLPRDVHRLRDEDEQIVVLRYTDIQPRLGPSWPEPAISQAGRRRSRRKGKARPRAARCGPRRVGLVMRVRARGQVTGSEETVAPPAVHISTARPGAI